MKPVYGMSSSGECIRALVAERLGYEPMARKPGDEERLKYYTRLEDVAAAEIEDMGFQLKEGGLCQTCLEKYSIERRGIHVEYDTPNFTLVGHLDRILNMAGHDYPVEIKCLGKSSWDKFEKGQFNSFLGYAAQECCYLAATDMPGIYWIMNRNDGEPLKYVVDNPAHPLVKLTLQGFERIQLPITIEQIVDKINTVELYLSIGELPDGDTDDCFFCRYKYLCQETGTDMQVIDAPDLVEAAETYKQGLKLEKEGKQLKSTGTQSLLLHAKQSQLSKFQVSLVSFSYHGTVTEEYFDQELFKKQEPEQYKKYLKKKKPYDKYSIRLLKGAIDE